MQVLVRGFHLAWPPLAYSITDDDEARRSYALIVSWFVAVISFAVVGLWLLAPWLVRLLADERFFEANEVVGPLAAGTALYALYLVLVVILGRTGRTELSFPATSTAVVVNVALNLSWCPSTGSSAPASRCRFLRRGRRAHVRDRPPPLLRALRVAPPGARPSSSPPALIASGETLVPHDGADGLALTLALCAAYPAGLWAARFLTEEERERLGALFARVRSGEALRRDVDEREARAEAAIDQAARDQTAAGLSDAQSR